MEIKINLSNIIDALIISIFPFQILSFVNGGFVKQQFVYTIYLLIILLDCIHNKSLIINNKLKKYFVVLIVCYFILPLLVGHISTIDSFLYVFLLLLFFLVCNIIGNRLVKNGKYIIKWWVIIGTFITCYFVLNNINEINNSTFINPFINSVSRKRGWFGFNHPNAFAIIIDSMLLIYCFYSSFFSKNSSIIKLILLLGSLLEGIALICTNSRTAIISIIIFLGMQLFFKYYSRFKSLKFRYIIILFLLLFLSLSLLYINYDNVSSVSSGRIETMIKGFESLDTINLLFGTTVSNISDSSTAFLIYDIKKTDNWYYMYITRFGLISLIIFMIATINLIYYVTKSVSDNKIKFFNLSLFVFLIVYSFGENVFYNQTILFSIMAWSLLSYSLYNKNFEVNYAK